MELLTKTQMFEDWLEQEEMFKHDYKNQVALLYYLTEEEQVKEKIKEITRENYNYNTELFTNLKGLPKGGLRGLIYYKIIVAKQNNINVSIDCGIHEIGLLKRLTKNEIYELSKIIGILLDNSIFEAKESRKKSITLEIYELDNKVDIVITNTFKEIINENEYLNSLLSKNNYLNKKKEIIDNYHIETLSILKNCNLKK